MNPAKDQKCAYTHLIARMCMKSLSVSFKSGWNYPLNACKILIWMILSSSSSSHVDLQTLFFWELNEKFNIIEGYHCVIIENNAIKSFFYSFIVVLKWSVWVMWPDSASIGRLYSISLCELIILWPGLAPSFPQAVLTYISTNREFWQVVAKYLRAWFVFFYEL